MLNVSLNFLIKQKTRLILLDNFSLQFVFSSLFNLNNIYCETYRYLRKSDKEADVEQLRTIYAREKLRLN